jgi:hypothetical protein
MFGLRARLIVVLVLSMGIAFGLLLIGANASLRADTTSLASQQVGSGLDALSASFASRAEQVRSNVLQASAQQQLISALQRHDADSLREIAADLALTDGFSFVVLTDPSGKIIAGNRTSSNAVLADPVVTSATQGSLIGGLTRLNAAEVAQLGGQGTSDVAAIVTASPVNVLGRPVGVLYAGQFVDATLKLVGDVGKFTGGETAIVVDGKIVATSLTGKDNAPLIGEAIPDLGSIAQRGTFMGRQSIDGVEYFSKIAPLTDFNGNVIGAYWFAVPYARFAAVVTHTLAIIAFWALVGLVIAVGFGVFFAQRLGAAIVSRSRQVNASARELSVLVVGGEVSGDHVVQTREKLETIERLASQLSLPGGAAESDAGQLRQLASEAVGDVIVIDTLTGELSTRLRDAASRVEQLTEVARALDALVAGTRPSRN